MRILYINDLKIFAVAAIAVTASISSGCSGKEASTTLAAGPPPPPVVLADVEQRTVPIFSEFVGQTKAFETVEVRARIEGVLERIYYTEGTLVGKGQLLASIDKREYQANVQSAKAALSKAEADLAQARQRSDVTQAQAEVADAEAVLSKADSDLARLKPLAAEKAVTLLELDAAVAAQKSAKATVNARLANLKNIEDSVKYTIDRAGAAVSSAKAALIKAELDLSYCDIYSPLSGIIGFKNVDIGNLVGRGEATLLATISSAQPLLVDVSIAEVDYLNIVNPTTGGRKGSGRPIEMILSNDTIHPYPGRLTVVDRKVDPATGTLKVQVAFQNPGNYLRPGQFARLRAAVVERENAILVPERAIQEMQGVKTVLVVDETNKASVRTVTVGDKSDTYLIVLDGLKPGEKVIVEGMQRVRPGSEVSPTAGQSAP
jgi:membrane fusion protein, multidrug efflux system